MEQRFPTLLITSFGTFSLLRELSLLKCYLSFMAWSIASISSSPTAVPVISPIFLTLFFPAYAILYCR